MLSTVTSQLQIRLANPWGEDLELYSAKPYERLLGKDMASVRLNLFIGRFPSQNQINRLDFLCPDASLDTKLTQIYFYVM